MAKEQKREVLMARHPDGRGSFPFLESVPCWMKWTACVTWVPPSFLFHISLFFFADGLPSFLQPWTCQVLFFDGCLKANRKAKAAPRRPSLFLVFDPSLTQTQRRLPPDWTWDELRNRCGRSKRSWASRRTESLAVRRFANGCDVVVKTDGTILGRKTRAERPAALGAHLAVVQNQWDPILG